MTASIIITHELYNTYKQLLQITIQLDTTPLSVLRGEVSHYVSARLTLNLPVHSEYIVASNQCSVVAIIIRIIILV